MNKLVMASCLICVFVAVAFSQNDDYKRNEFYAGFSNQQVNDTERVSLNGFEVAYVRNIHRYLGIKGDFSAAYSKKNQPNLDPIVTNTLTLIPYIGSPGSIVKGDFNRSLYNLVGGVQIKDNASQARVKPFAHALIGLAVDSSSEKNITCMANCASFVTPLNFESNLTGLSRIYGGGLDVKVSDKFDLRAIQVDYNPVYKQAHLKNLRLGVGLVF